MTKPRTHPQTHTLNRAAWAGALSHQQSLEDGGVTAVTQGPQDRRRGHRLGRVCSHQLENNLEGTGWTWELVRKPSLSMKQKERGANGRNKHQKAAQRSRRTTNLWPHPNIRAKFFATPRLHVLSQGGTTKKTHNKNKNKNNINGKNCINQQQPATTTQSKRPATPGTRPRSNLTARRKQQLKSASFTRFFHPLNVTPRPNTVSRPLQVMGGGGGGNRTNL